MHLKFNQLFSVNELRLKMGELDLVKRLFFIDNTINGVFFCCVPEKDFHDYVSLI